MRAGGTSTSLILGIETSCDETAASIVRAGSEVLSNVVASQMEKHALFGGVVPELASREHLRNIVPVIRATLSQAGVAYSDLDAVAVTQGPGLAGALLVGITYAKALAFALNKPLIAVNHLEGHIHAVLLETRLRAQQPLPLPLLALVVSGGHTHLYLAGEQRLQRGSIWHYRNVGRTVDDAAGEAFDKVAKLLGLGYPGGPWIDVLARHGDPNAVKFGFSQIKQKLHRAGEQDTASQQRFQFSFSGIKTAVLRYVEMHNLRESIAARREALLSLRIASSPINASSPYPASSLAEASPRSRLSPADALPLCDPQILSLIASFQRAVVDDLKRKTFAAAENFAAASIVVSGGVAANSELRERFAAEAAKRGLPIAFPALALSTDNAAMIAAAAWPKFLADEFASDDLKATPQLALG